MLSARVAIWLLALLVGALGQLSQADELEATLEGAADAVEGTELLNLYGPPLDEELDLQMTPLSDDDVLSSEALLGEAGADEEQPSLVTQIQEEEAQKQPPVWRGPTNDLSLIRFFHGRYYEVQYGVINNKLVRDVDTTSLEPNMAYLFEWLEREKKRGVSLLNQATVEALEQLTALSKLTEGNSCNRDSYTVVFKNDRATKGRTHKAPSKLGPLRRIDTIVHQLSLRHALSCFHVYPEKFNSMRFMELNQDTRRVVEAFMDGIIGDPNAISSKINAVKGKKAATLAYSAIKVHGVTDPNLRYLGKVTDERRGKLWVDLERVRGLVHRYLVEPCQDYVQALGPDVFVPARFDALMMESEDRYAPDSRLFAEFMHGWIHYRLCENFIKRDELPLTKNLVDYINKISK